MWLGACVSGVGLGVAGSVEVLEERRIENRVLCCEV